MTQVATKSRAARLDRLRDRSSFQFELGPSARRALIQADRFLDEQVEVLFTETRRLSLGLHAATLDEYERARTGDN